MMASLVNYGISHIVTLIHTRLWKIDSKKLLQILPFLLFSVILPFLTLAVAGWNRKDDPSVHAAASLAYQSPGDDTQEQEYNNGSLINTPGYLIMGGMRIFCNRWIPMSRLDQQDNWLRVCWWMTK